MGSKNFSSKFGISNVLFFKIVDIPFIPGFIISDNETKLPLLLFLLDSFINVLYFLFDLIFVFGFILVFVPLSIFSFSFFVGILLLLSLLLIILLSLLISTLLSLLASLLVSLLVSLLASFKFL